MTDTKTGGGWRERRRRREEDYEIWVPTSYIPKMMKTEGKTPSGGTRSSSPHRNAYEVGVQKLRTGKDGAPEAESEEMRKSRCKYGSNVHRIKNMFLQMATVPPGNDNEPAKPKEKPSRLTLPRAGSLNENVNHSALLKLGTSVSERVSHFDASTDKPASKLQEARRVFERNLQEKETTNRIFLRKERGGFQDRKLDVVVRFGGSTESLDKLDTDAVSPTVSQLSAVFENADLRNNIHKVPLKSPSSRRTRVFQPEATNDTEEKKPASKTVDAPHRPTSVQEICKIKPVEVEESGESETDVVKEAEPAKDEGPVNNATENGGTEAKGVTAREAELEEEVEAEAADEEYKREDWSEVEVIELSAYSGLGEDSGGSGLDEDEDGFYEPVNSCKEIEGLSEEEEPAPARKIRFSTSPIKVSHLRLLRLF